MSTVVGLGSVVEWGLGDGCVLMDTRKKVIALITPENGWRKTVVAAYQRANPVCVRMSTELVCALG